MSPGLSLKIYIELTPNPDAIKFVVSRPLSKSGTSSFVSKEAAKESPLAAKLFELDAVKEVLIGTDFVTVNKTSRTSWEALTPAIKTVIEGVLKSGEVVACSKKETSEGKNLTGDEAIAKKICEILETEIRPALERDGGDVVFYGYKDGIVKLHLQGACSCCPSASMTLKWGIENRLKQEIPEIIEVEQV